MGSEGRTRERQVIEPPRARRQPGRENDLRPRVDHFPSVTQGAPEFDRHPEFVAVAGGLARRDLEHRSLAAVQHQALEEPEVVHTPRHQPRVALHRGLGGPFQEDRHRQDGMPVDHVVAEDRRGLQVDLSLQDTFEVALGGSRPRRIRTAGRLGRRNRGPIGEHHDLDRAGAGVAVPDFLDHQPGAGRGPDQVQALVLEDRPEGIAHHAAGPRAPVERDDAAIRQSDGRLLRPLIEMLVGGRVGHLPGSPESSRRRREQQQELERLGVDRVEEVMQAGDFGVVHHGELRVGLVDDLPVGQDAGAVDEPPDRAMLGAARPDDVAHGRPVADVDRPIDDPRPRRRDPIEVAADLAIRQDAPEPFVDRLRRAAVGAGQEIALQFGLVATGR